MRLVKSLLVLSCTLLLTCGLSAQQSTNSFSPGSFTFVAVVNGASPATQTLTISPLATTPNWTIVPSTQSGGSWLSVSNLSGSGSGTSVITVTTGSLAAGSYTGEVLLTFTGTQDIEHIPVFFNVAPTQVTFNGNLGSTNPASQTLQLSIAGGGSLNTNWSATVSTTSGGNWLTVSPTNAASAPGSQQTLTISAAVSGLAIGSYSGRITLSNATFGTTTATIVPVVLNIGAPSLTLAPTTLTFNGSYGNTVAGQAVAVTAASGWSGSVATTSGGSWLSIKPTSGTGNGSFTVSVDISKLGVNTYSGTVTVTPAGGGTPVPVAVTLNVAGPAISVSPNTLTFTQVEGQVAPAKTVSLAASPSVSNWSVSTAVTGTNVQWLAASPGAGMFPSTPAIGPTAYAENLMAGTYSGTVTFTDPNSTPTTLTIPVTLIVTPAPPPNIVFTPLSLVIQGTQASGAPPTAILVQNTGSGIVTVTANSAVDNPSVAGNWLSVTRTGSVSLHSPVSLTVSVAANLPPNVYHGTITIDPGTGVPAQTISVQYIVTASVPQLLLGQTSLRYNMIAGGPAPATQSVELANTGNTAMSYTIRSAASTIFGSLTTTPIIVPSGASSSFQVPLASTVSALPAGNYYGIVAITYAAQFNPSAPLGSVYVITLLNVNPATAAPTVTAYPRGVILTPSALSQTVSLSTSSPSSVGVPVTVVVSTQSGGSWLSATAANPALNPTDTITITGVPAALPPTGVYQGTATAIYGDGTPSQDINVFLVVPNTSGSGAQSLRGVPAAACTQATLIMAVRQLATNFASSVGWPQNIEAQLVDNCTNPVTNATVLASFSTGDVPLALANVGGGLYAATWTPSSANPATVTITGIAPPLPPATAIIGGTVAANTTNPPVISNGGVVNAASFKGLSVSPGGIISVFGQNLALGNNPNGGFPLLTTLGGIKLSIGGIDMPLFFAGGGQVNAQVPSELPVNTPSAMVARSFSGSTETADGTPVPVTLSAATPGIFLTNAGVTLQGVVLNNPALQVVDASHPAAAGDVLTIYCTGLGATTPAVATGAPAPGNPPATANGTVTATFGTLPPVAVAFAGLTPGLVGLYQVNVAVPAGLPPSSATTLTLTESGVASNTVTIATK